mgnify:FL=1
MTGSLGFGLLWFVVILAAIPLLLWLLRRTPYGAAMSGQAAHVGRVVGTLSLGAQQRLVTVEVGQGEERRWLVLGVTAQSISALHTLTPGADAPAATPGAEPPFATLFKKVRDARR